MDLKHRLLLIVSIVLVALPLHASAYEVCLNSTQRYWQQDVFNVTSGGLFYSLNSTEACPYGCDGGSCVPTRTNDPVAFAIMFGLAAFVFVYVAMNINQKHALLSWMFLPIGVLMVFVGLMAIAAAGVYNDGMTMLLGWTGYGVFVVMLFLVFYFLIMMVSTMLGKTMKYGKKKDSGGGYG